MSVPIRILHVIEATEGGTRRWLTEVMRGLDGGEFQQDCVYAAHRDPAFMDDVDELTRNGHACFAVDMTRGIRPARDWRALRRIRAIVRAGGYDLVHGHSAKGGALARFAAASCAPVIYSPHAFSFLAGGLWAGMYRLIEDCARKWTTWLHAVSPSEAQQARELGFPGDRICVVPNGVSVTDAVNIERHDPPAVGALGALRPQKDPETFIRACALLHRKRPELRFVWGGDGPLRARIEAVKAPCVTLAGRIERPGEYLQNLDVFVACSRYEGMSYTLLDAMSYGLPIVATSVPGNRDVVEDGADGLLAPPAAPAGLGERIEWLLDHPGEAARMGRNARAKIRASYSLETQLSGMAALYRQAAAERPRK